MVLRVSLACYIIRSVAASSYVASSADHGRSVEAAQTTVAR